MNVRTRTPTTTRWSWGHSSAVVRVQKRPIPPSLWHPPPLIGRRCSGGALQTQTGMCEWAQCLLWTELRRLLVRGQKKKRRPSIIHLGSWFIFLGLRFSLVWSGSGSAVEILGAEKSLFLFFLNVFLRIDGEAQVDGQRRRWGAALVKFSRGGLKHCSVQLHKGLNGQENRLERCAHSGELLFPDHGGRLVPRGTGLVDQGDAWIDLIISFFSRGFSIGLI